MSSRDRYGDARGASVGATHAIILLAADDLTNTAIAMRLGTDPRGPMGRFAGLRLDGLFDEPRPRAPRKIGHEEIAETFRRTLEVRPSGATHWSLRRPQSSSLDGV